MQANKSNGHRLAFVTKFKGLLLVAAIAAAGMWAGANLSFGFHAALATTPPPVHEHRVVILIDSDDMKVMGHAVAYSANIARSFALKNETVKIEIVANGSGIKLFRADTSPLQPILAAVQQNVPGIVFSMCDSSRKIAEQKEGHAIELIPGARLVPFGVGRVIELQESGWSYIHG